MADGNHVTCFFCIKVMLHVLYKNKSYSKGGFTSASCQLLFLFDFSNISQEFILSSTCLWQWLFQYSFIYFMCWDVGVFQPKRHVTSVVWLGAAGMSIVKQLHITTRLTTSKRHPTFFLQHGFVWHIYIYIVCDGKYQQKNAFEREIFLIRCVYIYIYILIWDLYTCIYIYIHIPYINMYVNVVYIENT